jgi:ComF family protein
LSCNRKQSYLQHNKYNMKFIEAVVNLVAPHECVHCGKEGDLLCTGCSGRLSPVPERCYRCQRVSDQFRTCVDCRRHSPLFSVHAATVYEDVAKELLHRLKFERARAAANTIARIMATDSFPKNVLITNIPTANSRVRLRGYDQAALIAQALVRHLKQPYVPLLARLGEQRQLGQHRQARKQQMEHAFRPINSVLLQKKQIILIDDVLTTGATCEAAAHILREAGAARVSARVFAIA